MATTVTVTVDDGSNLASPDYSSLSAAEAGEQRDLVAADEIAELECYGFVDADAEVTFGGWTTSPTQYVQVRVADGHRHGGVWTGDGSAYVLQPSVNSFPISINAEHDVQMDGVQAFLESDHEFTALTISCGHDGTATTDCRFSDCLFRFEKTGTGTGRLFGAGSSASSNEFRWRNCVLWGSNFGSDATATLFSDNAGTHWVHNVTAHVVSGAGTTNGELESSFGEMHATNTRVSGVATFGNTSSDSDFNFSEDDSAPGSNSLTGQTPDYVDAPNGDFHLNSGDPGVDAGTDLSGDADYPVTTDFEGDSRPQGSAWDIGADELVSTGGPQTIGAPVATVDLEAPTPQIAPTTSVSAPVAPSVFESQAPAVAASVGLDAPVAAAELEAPAPTPDTSVDVLAPVAELLAEAAAPSVSTASDQTLSAPVAEALLEAVAPQVESSVSLSAPAGVVSLDAPTPSIAVGTVLSAPVAEALIEATAPALVPGTATPEAPVAETILTAPEPQVAASVGVPAPVASVELDALPPALQAQIGLSAPVADVELVALPPQVSTGTASPGAPVAVVTITVGDVTIVAIGTEVDLSAPYTAVWVHPDRTAEWEDPKRTARWDHPDRTAEWE